MVIEFHHPPNQINESIINLVRDRLIELYQQDKAIARAGVGFKEKMNAPAENKVCEIELTIYGDSLYVHREAESYERAAGKALATLTEKIAEQLKRQNEPPDLITSTVKV